MRKEQLTNIILKVLGVYAIILTIVMLQHPAVFFSDVYRSGGLGTATVAFVSILITLVLCRTNDRCWGHSAPQE